LFLSGNIIKVQEDTGINRNVYGGKKMATAIKETSRLPPLLDLSIPIFWVTVSGDA
jgi:hypothetical protein